MTTLDQSEAIIYLFVISARDDVAVSDEFVIVVDRELLALLLQDLVRGELAGAEERHSVLVELPAETVTQEHDSLPLQSRPRILPEEYVHHRIY